MSRTDRSMLVLCRYITVLDLKLPSACMRCILNLSCEIEVDGTHFYHM